MTLTILTGVGDIPSEVMCEQCRRTWTPPAKPTSTDEMKAALLAWATRHDKGKHRDPDG